jgi:hypothetical protein
LTAPDNHKEIMGERSLLLHALHEHTDRRPNALIDQDHENLFVIAKKHAAAAAVRSQSADLNFHYGLTHTECQA